jgi:4-alpha-glucanotransferase
VTAIATADGHLRDDLHALAALYEVQTSYVDASGQVRHAQRDALAAVLGALGADVGDPAGALRSERLRLHVQTVEPVVAVPAAGAQVVSLALPRALHPRDCWLSVESEDATMVHRSRLLPAIHRPLGSGNLEGRPMDRYEARVGSLSEGLAPGYYRLRIEGPGIDAGSLLVVAPRCPLPRRGWGAFLPLHAMRTASDWGVGSYGALGDLARWVERLGGQLVGTLPLYPSLLDGPVEISPYLPATRLGWNELYVDPTVLPELEASPTARALLGSDEFTADLAAARRSALVDYPVTMALVRRTLEPLARTVYERPSARRDALESFARQRPDLVAYARFRGGLSVGAPGAPTTDAAPGAPAPGAPAPGTAAGAVAGAAGPGVEPVLGNDEARYHLYAQWVAAQQLAAAGDDLLLDLPVGVHPDGFDTHWEPAAFAEGVEGGAPPDPFFAAGQQWGFRPLHPRALREQGYRYPIAVLRHAMQRAKVLRLDHVMGMYRLYWVPQGADAHHGVYVRYRDKELRAIVAVEAHRSGTAIVGEDLGTVPDEVRQGMARDRMLRSWVIQFEVSADAPLPDPPELSMASIGTHDLPRFAAFWDGPQRASWRRALGDDVRRALLACLDHLAAGPARLVLVDLEDLWLERWPHNRPGTGPEAGNWQHRAARTLEHLRDDSEVADALRRIDALRRQGDTE